MKPAPNGCLDEEQQNKRLDELRSKKKKDWLLAFARDRYSIESVDLKGSRFHNDAIRLLTEEARSMDVGPLVGKKLFLQCVPLPHSEHPCQRKLEGDGYEVIFVMASERSIEKV